MWKALGFVVAAFVPALAAPLAAEEFVARDKVPPAGEIIRDCPECPEMVVVPAGQFMMGSREDEIGHAHPQEDPQHRVMVRRPFAIGKYEVTFDEWDACIADGGCGGYRPKDMGWGRGRQPVINISFEDAVAYAEWLSRKTGQTYRLPSEAEWEYAARAGTTTAYHVGAAISTEQAAFGADPRHGPRNHTVPVGSFPPNGFGLHDVHGNVAEWTEDCWTDNYFSGPKDTAARTNGNCNFRVTRGGNWNLSDIYARSASRYWTSAAKGEGKDGNGFRVVRELSRREPDLEAGLAAVARYDYSQAFREFEPLAERGVAEAQFQLAILYMQGLSVAADPIQAYQWFRKAADQGHAQAQGQVGYMYSEGIGVLKSMDEALKWFSKAAEQGDVEAQYQIGYIYAEGVGVARDFGEARKWFRMAAEQGMPLAQYTYGMTYIHGQGVARDARLAREWWLKAAKQGLPEAQLALGIMYEYGHGVPRDQLIAFMWYDLASRQGDREASDNLDALLDVMSEAQEREARELVTAWINRSGDETVESLRQGLHAAVPSVDATTAPFDEGEQAFEEGRYQEAMRLLRPIADQGHPGAQFMLGVIYTHGLGVEADISEAAKLFRKAADSGIAEAKVNLGIFYEGGHGVAQDYGAAAALYREAADEGVAEAHFLLGNLYLEGLGVDQDLAEAVRLFRIGAEGGDVHAQHSLAVSYLLGNGVTMDPAESARWMRKAADSGLAAAQAALGAMYLHGLGVARDETQALLWLRRAAEQGNSDAQGHLGIVLSSTAEEIAAPDDVETVKWLRRAAEQGEFTAQLALGASYALGQGTRRDLVQAYKWFEIVVRHDAGERTREVHQDALEAQRVLADGMTARQIARAEKLAREWTAKPEMAEPSLPAVMQPTAASAATGAERDEPSPAAAAPAPSEAPPSPPRKRKKVSIRAPGRRVKRAVPRRGAPQPLMARR
jgi:TPR repeat protein/formylglycine-generating enzyme required for sulfatase activity